MSIIENIKTHFSDKNKITLERIKSARILFMFSALIFFLNLFLVGAKIYEELLLQFLAFTYSFFLLLLYVYICLYIKYLFQDKIYNLLYFIICFVILLFFVVALFPFIIEGGIVSFLNF